MHQQHSFLCLALIFASFFSFAQTSRSGFPAPQENRNLRMFPCGGNAILNQSFGSGSLPTGWSVSDVDDQNLAQQIDTTYQKGWHIIDDFKTEGNLSIASASWYDNDSTPADDWLILPPVQVGNNTCFSWFAYSQDRFFPESYEVLISLDPPSGPDMVLTNFDTLEIVEQEGFFINYRSLNLSDALNGAYQNQEVYLAFRHTSLDQFILVLDDIRIAEVEDQDLGVHPVETFEIEPEDSVFFRGGIRNYGSDTVTVDGDDGLEIAYTINGGSVLLDTIFLNDTMDFRIAPNDTLAFMLDNDWKAPSNSDVYYICLWSNWPTDQDRSNDTFCIRVGVGVDITSLEQLDASNFSIYPNPVQDVLYIEWPQTPMSYAVQLSDMMGKQVFGVKDIYIASAYQLQLSTLPPGVYVLEIRDEQNKVLRERIVKK